jgi:hypothetical protein
MIEWKTNPLIICRYYVFETLIDINANLRAIMLRPTPAFIYAVAN